MNCIPKITLFIYTYNHASFIAKAVEGAFSQTYSPLEIILSDDCSQDRTFGIMKEMAENYNGPHKVILNRNERNLGLGGHINKVVELTRGEWLAFAAGDDISKDYRISLAYDELMKQKCFKKIKYIGTAVDSINSNGKYIKTQYFNFRSVIALTGCMAIYHKDSFNKFPQLNSQIEAEDFILPIRSLLLGKILLINTSTVLYRTSNSNDFLDSKMRYFNFESKLPYSYIQRNTDLMKIKDNIDQDIYKYLYSQNNKYVDYTNKSVKRKQPIIEFYNSSKTLQIKFLALNTDFSIVEKVKLFLNSFKMFRLIKMYFIIKKNNNNINDNYIEDKKVLIDLEDVVNGEIIIEGVNNLHV